MNTTNHISQDDLLLFALQFMSAPEAAKAHEHVLTCDDCHRQLAWIQGDLATYAMTAEVHMPPVAARERLMRSIAQDKLQSSKTQDEAPGKRTNGSSKLMTMPAAETAATAEVVSGAEDAQRENVRSFDSAPVRRKIGVIGWAGWAVAATAIVAGGLQYQRSENLRDQLAANQAELTQVSKQAAQASLVMETLTDTNTKQVSLALPSTTAPTAVPEAHASYLGRKGSLVFVANHLNQLTADKTYELWLIPTGKGAAPIPAGTFRPDADGRAHLVMASLPKGVDVAAFGVTVEPDGGSSAPTMPIVLVGG
ncbi:anti-sigma factor [Granulicella paludicola]|uniref:anti-sigma factor n=1 Tax=Granulicella paludicola TaxID=474951 RepID=UPI0021E02DAC|nr:anti-sigma factor [Granulicella paludicola]